MRFVFTNYDADRDSFGWITNPRGRKYFESTARFATGSSASLWDLMQREAEVSLEVNDDRIFAGLWSYLDLSGDWLRHKGCHRAPRCEACRQWNTERRQ